MVDDTSDRFYERLQPHSGFADLADPACFVPLPDDWTLGVSDVVTSTAAIEAGRYKAVNTAGAAVVSAVSNALGTLDFPFVFSGDGASFAVGPNGVERAKTALAATLAWVGQELDLVLRGAAVSINEVRRAGHDIKVARFAVSPDVSYAMFSGGGRAWAERQLKAGALAVPSAPPGARPDLTGLSCRFRNMGATNGVILSLIVIPTRGTDDPEFGALAAAIIRIAAEEPRAAHPVPHPGPEVVWSTAAVNLEARLQRGARQPLILSQARAAAWNVLASWATRPGRHVGAFSADVYRRQVVDNSDFRKFDDGLMMTLDCSLACADRVAAALSAARDAGTARFGLHRQSEALVTCVVPSALKPGHVHFVDGASGGYAMAARDLKASPPDPNGTSAHFSGVQGEISFRSGV